MRYAVLERWDGMSGGGYKSDVSETQTNDT